MGIEVIRKDIYFKPDPHRVLARYFNLSKEQKEIVIRRVLGPSDLEID